MKFRFESALVAATLCGTVAAILASCSSDDRSPASVDAALVNRTHGDGYSMCHRSGSFGVESDVSASEMSSRRNHGDYLTKLYVSHDADLPSDGAHFRRIGDAIAAARAGRLARGETQRAACRITIDVAAGVYSGDYLDSTNTSLEFFPMVIDVPDITLHGAYVPQLLRNGRPTGLGTSVAATTISPVEPLGFDAITEASIGIFVANGHPNGSAGNGLTIEGFVFQSNQAADGDAGGQGITGARVENISILGNRFEAGFTESIDLRSSTGVLRRNHLGGTAGSCDICLAGPGAYEASSNMLLAGGIPGILVVPAFGLALVSEVEEYVSPDRSTVDVDIFNNEVHDHLRMPVGVGIRLGAIGVGSPDVAGHIRARIHDNALINNRFGMIFEAAFPVPGAKLKGDIDATIYGNKFVQSCQTNLLIAFSRHTTVLGLTDLPYLLNSTYRIDLNGNLKFRDVWYGDPAGFGNRLFVDGHLIPNGARQFYSADGCPNLGT
jgi:hypothetical protein